jgi:glycosyltransferase involved in cell wall biosynthesis
VNGEAAQPKVTVVTPVYNGEAYLAECIESVLAQSYRNWRYVIVDNCSTDRTPEIAARYAVRDRRIEVRTNASFLPMIENHNAALECVSADSKYCKPLMADDWLMPRCIEEMVTVAERYPAVGLVGCYAFDGVHVLYDGLPYRRTPIAGREACRAWLLGGPYVFGTPTSMLFPTTVLRGRTPFFNPKHLHADFEACFEVLRDRDYGFVYQVLAFNRVHGESESSRALEVEGIFLGMLAVLVKFGPIYLEETEFDRQLQAMLRNYYRKLGKNALRLRDRRFWRYQDERMRMLGLRLSWPRLGGAIAGEILSALKRPADALHGARKWWPVALSRALGTHNGRRR